MRQQNYYLLVAFFLAWNLFVLYRDEGGEVVVLPPPAPSVRSDIRLYPSNISLINLTDFR